MTFGSGKDDFTGFLQAVYEVQDISPEEENALAAAMSRGDEAARKKLIEANMKYAVDAAKKDINKGIPFMDLIETALKALEKAADSFVPGDDLSFSKYSEGWVRYSLGNALSKTEPSASRIPEDKAEPINRMLKAARKLLQEKGREPSFAEIAAELGTTEAEVKSLFGLFE